MDVEALWVVALGALGVTLVVATTMIVVVLITIIIETIREMRFRHER